MTLRLLRLSAPGRFTRLPPQGGVVTVQGTGFDATSTVSVAGGSAIVPNAVSATSLSFLAPAAAAGAQASLAVVTGEQSFVVDNALRYVVPALASLSPATGDTDGGLEITLHGSGFLPGATVQVGANAATSVTVAADGASLRAYTPSATATGAVAVTVTNPGGSSSVRAGAFTYVAASQQVVIASNAVKYNLAAALGNPTVAKHFVVTVNAGVVLSSDVTSAAAFDTGVLPAGSSVTLVNRGHILGKGGRGGHADLYTVSHGLAGGDAVNVRVATTINNLEGYLWGGGGGGGGGSADSSNGSGGSGGGGAGGGAAGTGCSNPSAFCYDGQAGTAGTAGTGGAGGYAKYRSYFAGTGGAYGQPGAKGYYSTPGSNIGMHGNGGAAGYAVRKNGMTVTFTAGNDAARVKGLVN